MEWNIKKYLSIKIFFLAATFLIGIAVVVTDLFIGVSSPERLLIKIIVVIIASCIAF